MKFIVSKSDIQQHLQLISGVVVSKPVLSILSNFHFNISNGGLHAMASDLQTFVKTRIKVDAGDDAQIAVPSKLTLDILKSLPDQPLTFSVDSQSGVVEINSGNGRYKLGGQPASDFPTTQDIAGGQSFTIPANVLLRAIEKTVSCTGNDEMKMNLTGIYFELHEDKINFVATDANRLVRYTRTDIKPGIKHSFILPKKPAQLLKNTLPNNDTSVTVRFTGENAHFSYGDVELTCRLIEERYPDYNNVIPKENPNKMGIDRDDFLDSVRRVSILSNSTTRQIRLKIKGNDMILSAEDFDQSNEGHERLVCEYSGEDMEIGFNSSYLQELLATIDSDRVTVELSSPNRAGVVLPEKNEEQEELLMLIMPMMLSNY